MMMAGNGQLSVPPGFRFHPTDEELLYYYLRKKVSYEAIDLDVIREVDLNKLEPWDLKDKCRIGSGPQNEWYFFSHKDKKYPTGTRTNRATTAGFWKATGRDKAIHLNSSRRIGMRKTLVFYTGRAPHGQKTDWIMHEYRLEEDDFEVLEDGWVVCRVFKKKNHNRCNFQLSEVGEEEQQQQHLSNYSSATDVESKQTHHHHHQHQQLQALMADYNNNFDGSMQLPQLFSPESAAAATFISPISLNNMDFDNSHNNNNLLSLKASVHDPRFNGGDWSFLDKLLAASHHNNNNSQHKFNPLYHGAAGGSSSSSSQKLPFHYLGCHSEIMKFSK